jgi:AraC-like DNA-binding protein
MLPLGIVQVIVHLDGAWAHRPAGAFAWTERPDVFVGGPFSHGYDLRAAAGTSVISIEFSPSAAARYIPIPVERMTGQVVSPVDLFGSRCGEWLDQIQHSSSPQERARGTDLLLQACRRSAGDPAVAAALEHVRACGGVTTVAHLSTVAELSPAQFRRRFKAATGLAAKHFLRIRRLIAAVSLAQRRPHFPLAHVAHLCGYADQAHLGHDFQAIAACSPSQFLGQ